MNGNGKFFIMGAIFGSIFIMIWDYNFNHKDSLDIAEKMTIEQLKIETSQMLLNYIDGTWFSSANDLVVSIDSSDKKEVVVTETISKSKSTFKIQKLEKVSGVFGFVKLQICDIRKNCELPENQFLIQINKVFGIDNAITMTYDSRMTYCSEVEDSCVRGFKRHAI